MVARSRAAFLLASALACALLSGAADPSRAVRPPEDYARPAGLSALSRAMPRPPAISARSAAVIDAATGTLLYGKNPDTPIPPASLAKLVTLHIVYQEIAAGRLSKSELVTIDKRDCSPYIPNGSSLMYLQPGMKVTVLDLMRGAAVVSGNDAAFALARRVSGSNEAFAERMNAAVRALGLGGMRFVEPSGLSELNRVTARQFAQFCKAYMELHPEATLELHSLRYIEFPRPEHATAAYVPEGKILQYNRNALVQGYEGCDGLKTGYIIESGYNLAATALRPAGVGESVVGTRIIAVTLGGSGGSTAGGGDLRSKEGAELLDWSFENFATAEPELGELPSPRAWFGAERRLELVPEDALTVTLPRSELGTLKARIEVPDSVEAPVLKGKRIGEVVYSAGGQVLRRVDLIAARDVPKGNILRQIVDIFERLFTRLFSKRP